MIWLTFLPPSFRCASPSTDLVPVTWIEIPFIRQDFAMLSERGGNHVGKFLKPPSDTQPPNVLYFQGRSSFGGGQSCHISEISKYGTEDL